MVDHPLIFFLCSSICFNWAGSLACGFWLWYEMSGSTKVLDPAFQGAGQKPYSSNYSCFLRLLWMFWETVWSCWAFNTFFTEELKSGGSRILRQFQFQSLSMGSFIWETLTLSCRFAIPFIVHCPLRNRATYVWEISSFMLWYVLVFHLAQTTQNKGGAYLFDIHFWIGKDTSQVHICKTLLLVFDSYDRFWLLLSYGLDGFRMNLEQQLWKQLNSMQFLEAVLYNTGRFRVMNLTSSCLTSSHVLYR